MTVSVLLTMLMVANPPPPPMCTIDIITEEKESQENKIPVVPMTEFKANLNEGGHYMDKQNPVLRF